MNVSVKTKNTLLEDIRYLFGGFSAVVLNVLILGIISSGLVILGFNEKNTPVGLSISLTSLSFLITGIAVIYLVDFKIRESFRQFLKRVKETLSLNWIGVRKLILAAVIAPFIYFSSIAISILLSNFFESGGGNSTSSKITSDEGTSLVLAIVFVVLLTPIVEELFFRGVILGSLLRFSDSLFWKIVAIGFSSLFFGLMHVQGPLDSVSNILAFTAPFTLGLVAAILRVTMKSIYPSIAIHIAYNMLVTILMFGL